MPNNACPSKVRNTQSRIGATRRLRDVNGNVQGAKVHIFCISPATANGLLNTMQTMTLIKLFELTRSLPLPSQPNSTKEARYNLPAEHIPRKSLFFSSPPPLTADASSFPLQPAACCCLSRNCKTAAFCRCHTSVHRHSVHMPTATTPTTTMIQNI